MSGAKEETAIVARAKLAIVLVLPRCIVWRAGSGGNGFGHRCNSINLPDIVGYQDNGKFIAVEVKTATGKLTAEQCEFLKDVRSKGGYAAVYAPIKEGGLEDFFRYPDDVPEKFLPRGVR